MKRNGRLKTEAAMNILYNLSYQKICLAYLCSTSSSIGEGNGNPLRYSCLENPMDGGSRRVGHDWATSLSLFTFMHWRGKWQPTPVFLPGEFQGRGATVYGKAQSWTWLKWLNSSSSSRAKELDIMPLGANSFTKRSGKETVKDCDKTTVILGQLYSCSRLCSLSSNRESSNCGGGNKHHSIN